MALNPINAKLTKRECAAVLTLGFGTFTNDNTGMKLDDMRTAVVSKISEGKSEQAFWKTINETPAHT